MANGDQAKPKLKRRDLRILLRLAEIGLDKLSDNLVEKMALNEDTAELERVLDEGEGACDRVEEFLEC